MKKSLKDYLLDAKKETVLKIRFAGDFADNEEMMTRLERFLKKYDVVKVEKPNVTMFQTHPLGFSEPTNSEVTIVEVTVLAPVSTSLMRTQIAKMFGFSETYVVVNRADEILDADEEAKEEKEMAEYESKLTTDPTYPEDKDKPKADEMYGDKYNEEMISTLSDARKEARKTINKTA